MAPFIDHTIFNDVERPQPRCNVTPLLSRRSRQRERLSASMLSICSSVC